MRRKTKRQTKIQKSGVTKIRVFMKGVTKATPKMINKAQQAAMHSMNVRNAILEEVLKERTGLKTIPLTDDQKRRLAQAGAKVSSAPKPFMNGTTSSSATNITASAKARRSVAQRPSLTNFGTQS